MEDYLEPCFGEIGNDGGNECNSTFPGIDFFRNSDDHAAFVLSAADTVASGLTGAAPGGNARTGQLAKSVITITAKYSGELKTVTDWLGEAIVA